MSYASKVHNVIRWLKSKDIVAPEDWVSACLEWLSSENPVDNQGEKLNQMVYEQWLYTNIRDLDSKTLPDSINNDLSTLTGRHSLQVESVLDISRTKQSANESSKSDDITSTSTTQNKWEKKAARLLMMRLSDGSISVDALEFKRIPSLSEGILLGTKVRIKGPVKCRRGVLLLEAHNIDILGGEVEDFNQGNNNVNDENRIVQIGPSVPGDAVISNLASPVLNTATHTAVQNRSVSIRPGNEPASSPLQRDTSSHETHFQSVKQETDFISLISDDDEEIIQYLEQNEQASVRNRYEDLRTHVESKASLVPQINELKEHSVEKHQPCLNRQDKSSPTYYLCHCKKYLHQKLPQIRVKAIVATLLSKLKYDISTGWLLKASICDGSATLEVDFSHNVLETLIGHSGNDGFSSSANPEFKKGLDNCRNTIMSVCHYMDIVLSYNESRIGGVVLKIDGIS